MEINTYRLLESALPVKTPRFYYGDISNETSNYILITERVPFAEIGGRRAGELQAFEVEGPYEKCKDFQLRGPAREYYLLIMEKLGVIAGAHKAGKMGSEDHLKQSVSTPPADPARPEMWGLNPQGPSGEQPGKCRKKLEAGAKFFSDTAKVIFPDYAAGEAFKSKFTAVMMKMSAYTSEIFYWQHCNPDYLALGHQNLNMDNAYFWRDGDGKLDCGLFDWGGFGYSLGMPRKIWWCLNCSDFDDTKAHLQEYISTFVEKYHEHGGPLLDHGTMWRGVILSAMQCLMIMVASVPDCLKMCPAKEWATIRGRDDPKIASNVHGKSTLRTTLQAMLNGLRVIEELKGDEVLEQWVQDFWVGQLQQAPKTEAMINGA